MDVHYEKAVIARGKRQQRITMSTSSDLQRKKPTECATDKAKTIVILIRNDGLANAKQWVQMRAQQQQLDFFTFSPVSLSFASLAIVTRSCYNNFARISLLAIQSGHCSSAHLKFYQFSVALGSNSVWMRAWIDTG